MLRMELSRKEAEMLQGILASYQLNLQVQTWCADTPDAREDVEERDKLVLSIMRRLTTACSQATTRTER